MTDSSARELEVGGLYVHAGLEPNTEFVEGALSLDKTDRIEVDQQMQTSVQGIYAVGDVRERSPGAVAAAVGAAVQAVHSVSEE